MSRQRKQQPTCFRESRMRRTALLVVLASVIVAIAFVSWPSASLRSGMTADRVLIQKRAHRLTLYRNGIPLKAYRVSLGKLPMGKKEREGDNRTPEGIYRIDRHNLQSSFHKVPSCLVSKLARCRARKSTRCADRRRCHDSRIAEWPRLAWPSSTLARLDGRLYRRNQ